MRLTDQLKAKLLQCVATWWLPCCAKVARNAVYSVRAEPAPVASRHRRQLLIDVSIIAASDAGTGIQRVVRSLLFQLQESPPQGMEIRPIWATRTRKYQYADFYLGSAASPPVANDGLDVEVHEGDIFLGLDLTSRIAPRRQSDFLKWRASGVRFVFVVYDLLPMRHPEWFTPRARKSFRHWVSMLAIHADALFCISRSVAVEARHFMGRRFGLTKRDLSVRWFHLGADIPSEAVGLGGVVLTEHKNVAIVCSVMVLMVGTIEPRKGHAQVLDAFEQLWREGIEAQLIIVGKPGWQMEMLIKRLESHPEAGRRLLWLPNADDAHLARLYARTDGLLMASEAEGFGLPIIEAARYEIPIFARDLPVFREVAGEHATYFSARNGVDLADELADWLQMLADGTAPASCAMRPLTWAESAEQLKRLVAELDDAR